MEKKNKMFTLVDMLDTKQYWDLKYQIQDPIILHVYELNIVNVVTV